jgi:predicted MFS family arabinose efflux permease
VWGVHAAFGAGAAIAFLTLVVVIVTLPNTSHRHPNEAGELP